MSLTPPLVRLAPMAVAAGLLFWSASAHGQPAASGISPGAAAPGKTTDLVLSGAKLDQPLRVWSCYPGIQIEAAPGDVNQKGNTQLPLKVTLPADAPCGVAGLVVATGEGISDVLYFLVDDLPSLPDNGNNHTPETAQEVPVLAAVDGIGDGTVFDYYRIAAKANQRLSLEIVANRLGSDFDGVLRLLDPAGNELVLLDDDLSLGADCRASVTFPADGVYVLEVRDNRYKAGGRYRLRIGDFPLVSTPFPLGVPLGGAAQLTLAGPLAEASVPVVAAAPAGMLGRRLPVSAKLHGGASSGFGLVAASDLAEFAEAAPGQPTSVQIPCGISGRLEAPKSIDSYVFVAAKGTRITAKAFGRSLHSPAIVSMKLYNAAGAEIGQSPVTESEEESFSVVLPETATYKLTAEDLLGRGGPEFTYRIEIRTGPSFALNVKPDQAAKLRPALAARGALTIDVQVARSGYDGPIRLDIDAPRGGWQVFNNVIGEKAAETRLYVVAPADLGQAEIVPVRIVGTAMIEGAVFSAAASTEALLKAARPHVPFPPSWLDGTLLVSGLGTRPDFYQVAVDRAEVNFPRLVGQTQLVLTMDRTDGNFKDVPLTVLPLGLPAGVTAEIKRQGNGPKEAYEVILRGPKDLAEGRHAIRFLAYAEMAGRGQALVTREVALNVVTPLSVSIAPAGPLIVGQTQKVKVALVRRGDDRQPVDVKFKKLPAGVSLQKVTVNSDQSEIELELAAAADAAQGVFGELAVTATTKYAGVDVAVDSPNVNLEVKAP